VKIFKNPIAFFAPVFAFTATAMAAEGAEAAADSIPLVWWIAPIGSLLALGFAVYFYKKMMSAPEGTEKMIEIARHVREGAYAYLFRQYGVVSIAFLVLLIIFMVLAYFRVQNPFVPVAFLTGGFFSGLCGFLGMKTATNASAACLISQCGISFWIRLFIPRQIWLTALNFSACSLYRREWMQVINSVKSQQR
jgi:hypothetical protein